VTSVKKDIKWLFF